MFEPCLDHCRGPAAPARLFVARVPSTAVPAGGSKTRFKPPHPKRMLNPFYASFCSPWAAQRRLRSLASSHRGVPPSWAVEAHLPDRNWQRTGMGRALGTGSFRFFKQGGGRAAKGCGAARTNRWAVAVEQRCRRTVKGRAVGGLNPKAVVLEACCSVGLIRLEGIRWTGL